MFYSGHCTAVAVVVVGGGLIKMTGIVVLSLTRYRDCFVGLRLVSFNFKNSIIYKEKTKEINV